jgi:hypothetical protein
VIVEAPLAVVVALLGVGGVLLFGGVAGIRRLGHLRRTPVLPIAQAGDNTFVAIQGKIVASEEGLATAPFSEREAAWFKVVVEGKSGKSWDKLLDESEGRVFLVDDGSGELARVDPNEATFEVASDLSSSGRIGHAPKLEAYLDAHKLKVDETLAGMFGIHRMVRYTETALLPGETVLAVGHARRMAGPPVMDGYRSGSTTELVVAPSGRDPLLVSNRTREAIVREPRGAIIFGLALVAVGLVLLVPTDYVKRELQWGCLSPREVMASACDSKQTMPTRPDWCVRVDVMCLAAPSSSDRRRNLPPKSDDRGKACSCASGDPLCACP